MASAAGDIPQFTGAQFHRDLSHIPPKAPPTAPATRRRQLHELGLYGLRLQLSDLAGLSRAKALASHQASTSPDDDAWSEELERVTSTIRDLASVAGHGNHGFGEEGKQPKTAVEAATALWGPGKSAGLLKWSKAGYLAAIHKDTTGLPLVIRCDGQWSQGRGKDEGEHQSMRDVERDVLRLNGVVFRAGLGGYPKVVRWLEDVMRQALHGTDTPTEPLGLTAERLQAFSRAVLRSVNRTSSGGAAYDVLCQVLALDDVTAVVPDSKAAGPLTVDVDIGAFLVPGSSEEWAWGLRVRVSALTVYDLYNEPVEDHWAKVTAEYRKRLFLPLVRERTAEQGSSGEWLETEAEVHLSDS